MENLKNLHMDFKIIFILRFSNYNRNQMCGHFQQFIWEIFMLKFTFDVVFTKIKNYSIEFIFENKK